LATWPSLDKRSSSSPITFFNAYESPLMGIFDLFRFQTHLVSDWMKSGHKINIHFFKALQFARLFAKLYQQETVKWPWRSSSQAATCYYQSNLQR